MYQDENVCSVKDNWAGVISKCLQMGVFPSIVFYEKLADEYEDDAIYEARRGLDLVNNTSVLNNLQALATQIDDAKKRLPKVEISHEKENDG